MLDNSEEIVKAQKQAAAEMAVDLIKNGMIVGLGTGSTVYFAIVKLGEKIKNGLNIKVVSTSNETSDLAKKLCIPLTPINDVKYIDVTIDGADEVDIHGNGIKGGGGALLIEKIVASHSKRNIWMVSENKMVDQLGKFPLPVEVIPFGFKHLYNLFKDKGYNPKLRLNKQNDVYLTDNNHYIIDLQIGKISNPPQLQTELKLITGVVETGLFINIVTEVITGYADGVRINHFRD